MQLGLLMFASKLFTVSICLHLHPKNLNMFSIYMLLAKLSSISNIGSCKFGIPSIIEPKLVLRIDTCFSALAGKEIIKVEPTPSSDSAVIFPFINLTSYYEFHKPKPVPPNRL